MEAEHSHTSPSAAEVAQAQETEVVVAEQAQVPSVAVEESAPPTPVAHPATLSTALPVEDLSAAVPLTAHTPGEDQVHEAEMAAPPDPLPTNDGSASDPEVAVTAVTSSTNEHTPALPSPVPQLSAAEAPSLSQMAMPVRTPEEAGDEAAPRPAHAEPAQPAPAARANDAHPPPHPPPPPAGRTMQEAVQRSMEVYADAHPNTAAFMFDTTTTPTLERSTARSSVPAGTYVQTASGLGVTTDYQRGHDNSHTNRMVDGSYSRFLEATRDVPEPEVYPSFYGAEPLAGAPPVSLLASQQAMETARIAERFRVTHPGMTPQATLDGGLSGSIGRGTGGLDESWSARSRGLPHDGLYSAQPHPASRTADELAEWGGTDNRGFTAVNRRQRVLGGASSASVLRREMDLLEPEVYQELAEQRSLRRRAPPHCKPVRQERDFVYYNHRSKGFFVPHDLPPDTIVLNYNHTFDFGIGTRFLTGERPARRNPGAQAPLLYSEMTRGSRGWQTRTHPSLYNSTRAQTTRSAAAPSATLSVNPRHKTREHIATQSHSLRTAHALRTEDIHTSQCRQPRTIEDVMAQSPAYLAPGTVGSVKAAVATGKVTPQEIPSQLRTAVDIASARQQQQRSEGEDNASYRLSPSRNSARATSQPRGGRLHTTTPGNAHIPSPSTSARTATPSARFTDKPTRDVLGVMGTAAATASASVSARRADLSGLAARQQQRLNERPATASGGTGEACLPHITGTPRAVYGVSRLHV